MSKKGRKTRPWHYRRIQQEFGEEPETIIQEMFEEGHAITVIAGVLGLSYGETHEWIQELGLSRPPIRRCSQHPVKERIRHEFGFDPIRLICSDRAMGMTYREIGEKYRVSNAFIAGCLRQGAPWLIGDQIDAYKVRPDNVSEEGRRRRSENARRHNQRMKAENRGWFADMHLHFRTKYER